MYKDIAVQSESVELTRHRGLDWMVDALIGAEIPLGPGFVVTTASGSYAPVMQSFISGNLGGLHFSLGYRYPL